MASAPPCGRARSRAAAPERCGRLAVRRRWRCVGGRAGDKVCHRLVGGALVVDDTLSVGIP